MSTLREVQEKRDGEPRPEADDLGRKFAVGMVDRCPSEIELVPMIAGTASARVLPKCVFVAGHTGAHAYGGANEQWKSARAFKDATDRAVRDAAEADKELPASANRPPICGVMSVEDKTTCERPVGHSGDHWRFDGAQGFRWKQGRDDQRPVRRKHQERIKAVYIELSALFDETREGRVHQAMVALAPAAADAMLRLSEPSR